MPSSTVGEDCGCGVEVEEEEEDGGSDDCGEDC